MFANIATIVSALATLAAVAPSAHAYPSTGLAGRHIHRNVPAQFQEEKRDYAEDSALLEPYADYHERYDLFSCASKHNTTFWDSCCHPLLANEDEDVLPDVCFEDIPCDSTSSTSVAIETSTSIVATPTATSEAAPTTSQKAATTSVVVPPSNPEQPITSHSVAPTTTKAASKPAATTSKAPAPTTSSSSGGAWRTGGVGTYFYQNGNAGACGNKHSDNDLIVAIDIAYYGNTGAVSSYCGKTVQIVNLNNGNTVNAIVADVCPTCVGQNSLDMSLGTFKALDSNLGDGEFPIKYRVL